MAAVRSDYPVRIAHVSTYPPRECGIATFCEDLVKAVSALPGAGAPIVVAMVDGLERQHYGWPIRFLVEDREEQDYLAAARFLNDSPADIVSIQHEFGIFGGPECPGLSLFLDELAKPVVATLHTVLPRPSPAQAAMVRALAERAERLVVMNAFAREILATSYGADPSKVVVLHHGAPPPHPDGRERAKASLGLSGRKVISTFGLVSPGKGLEYAIRALPAIRARHPEVRYLIIGKTHPGIQRRQREAYRDELTRLAEELGVRDSVEFVNHYQTKEGIARYLAATDIYLTPYLNQDQIVSGTLAYAMAAGKAIVSTPYLYARFLLAEGRGRLVGFRDPADIASAVSDLLDDPAGRRALEARCLEYGRRLYWPNIGRQFLALCRGLVAPAALVDEGSRAWAPALATEMAV